MREWLEIAYRRHDPALVWSSVLRNNYPLAREILKRMGLDPAAAVISAPPSGH
jgi:hypothetical protein